MRRNAVSNSSNGIEAGNMVVTNHSSDPGMAPSRTFGTRPGRTTELFPDPDGPVTAIFRDIARRVAARLSLQAKDYRQAFPSIMIQNN